MKKVYASLLLVVVNLMAFAQEKKTDIDVNINKHADTSNWYASPWLWVLGAAVFIILLVALTSGGSRRSGSGEKVTVTKTVRRDAI